MARGRWFFALRTGDEIPNWSPLSNNVAVSVGDSIAPDIALVTTDDAGNGSDLSNVLPFETTSSWHATRRRIVAALTR